MYKLIPRVLTIFMEKPEIPVRKSNIWFALFRLGSFVKDGLYFDSMQFFYSFQSVRLSDLDILLSGRGLFSHQVKFYSLMFMHKISTGGLCKWVSTPGFPESSPGSNLILSTVQRPIFSFT